MASKPPGFLRIHSEEDELDSIKPAIAELPGMAELCQAFTQVTGWPLQFVQQNSAQAWSWEENIGGTGPRAAGKLAIAQQPADRGSNSSTIEWPLTLEQSTTLAKPVAKLFEQLYEAHFALRQREAELAMGIPVSSRPDDEEHLAERLQAVLEVGANLIGCDATALYLLDDATSELKLRASSGLSDWRFMDEARPLRGAVADLEALVGHAVVLEDTTVLPQWKVPEEFPSAVCVPVATSSNPIGTLWFFAKESTRFSSEQTEVAEIISGRISSDLEREVLLQQEVEHRLSNKRLKLARVWQQDRLPDFPPLVDGWEIGGWSSKADVVGGDAFDWSVLNDGCIATAVLAAQGTPFEAALTVSSVHGALKALAPLKHTPKEMVNRINDSLWTASCGDQFASIGYAQIHPETGVAEYSAAGSVEVFHIRSKGYRRLTRDPMDLGSQPDPIFRQSRLEIGKGEMFVLASEGVMQVLDDTGRPMIESALLHLCYEGKAESVAELVSYVQVLLESAAVRPGTDRTIVLVRRQK